MAWLRHNWNFALADYKILQKSKEVVDGGFEISFPWYLNTMGPPGTRSTALYSGILVAYELVVYQCKRGISTVVLIKPLACQFE